MSLNTYALRDARGHSGRKTEGQSLQFEQSRKKQALSVAEEEPAEIEITVSKEKPDGTSLYRELYGIMAKKVEVFYLKCVVDKKGCCSQITHCYAITRTHSVHECA